MKDFFGRLFNTEFLPMSEVRKIKFVIVLVFLLFITILTVPFSFLLDYTIGFKIGSLVVFLLMYLTMFLLLRFSKIALASQFSMVYMFLITGFYTQGTSSFYAYLSFYILLMIIVFYQELYWYLFYGTFATAFGVSYVLFNQGDFISLTNQNWSTALLMATLFLFYVVFLVQIFYSEKLYTDLNLRWVQLNHVIDKHQEMSLYYLTQLRKKQKTDPMVEHKKFQQAANEAAIFIAEQYREHGKDILNVLDLYLYIHERGLAHIVENDDFSIPMKRIASRLDKYLLNKKSDMMTMILNFQTIFQESSMAQSGRYDLHLREICPRSEDQIIAFALLYLYLANEVTSLDQYDQMSKVLTTEEIDQLLTSNEAFDFFGDEILAFYKENRELFLEYLHLDARKE